MTTEQLDQLDSKAFEPDRLVTIAKELLTGERVVRQGPSPTS